jgi:hypothetical protein
MRIFCIFAVACWSHLAMAHPVAFKGSTGIMGYHSSEMTEMEINHSLKHWFAPAVQTIRYRSGTSRPDLVVGKLNFLLHRWNGENYQANIYLHGGAGKSITERRGIYHGGITADIEDRKFYLFGEWNSYRSSVKTELQTWKVRAGFAPYVAPFESLHSWFIVELKKKSLGDRRIEVVPTLRFFYQNVLWEVGASLSGHVNLNYIIHF